MANGTLKVQNIETSSGSGTITLGQSGETITAPTGVTVSGGLSNSPAFIAALSSNFTLGSGTRTLITFDATGINVGNSFDTSNNRFTAPETATYFLSTHLQCDDLDDTDFFEVLYYRNGLISNFDFAGHSSRNYLTTTYASGSSQNTSGAISTIINLQKDDYIEVYARHNQGSNQVLSFENSYFSGYKLIGV